MAKSPIDQIRATTALLNRLHQHLAALVLVREQQWAVDAARQHILAASVHLGNINAGTRGR